MKPLPAAPLTDEDCVCLVLNADAKKLHWRLLRHGLALAADRRDAELMLQYVQCTVPKGRHAQIGGECGWFAGQTQL